MTIIALLSLLSCAHHAVRPPALDGGWSSAQMGLFIGIEGAESSPAVWVVQSGDEAAWVALTPACEPEGVVSFRLPEGAPSRATFRVSLEARDRAHLVLEHDSGREEVVSLSRTAPRSRADLEALIAALAQAELEGRTADHVWALMTVEIAYHAAFGEYVSVPIGPRPLAELTPDPVSWSERSALDRLGWAPGEPVRGSFQVEVAADGSGFTVHGWQDLDGDGVPAHWSASQTSQPTRMSALDIR